MIAGPTVRPTKIGIRHYRNPQHGPTEEGNYTGARITASYL